MIQSLSKPAVAVSQHAPPERPGELQIAIARLPRVRGYDDASAGADSEALVPERSTLTVELSAAVERDDIDVVVLSGVSGAEIARRRADTGVEHVFQRVPIGNHAAVLVRHSDSAQRAYIARVAAQVTAKSPTRCTLPAEFSDLVVAMPLGTKAPILALTRADDPEWHVGRHASNRPERDGTVQVRFPDVGHGTYDLTFQRLGTEPVTRELRVAGPMRFEIRPDPPR